MPTATEKAIEIISARGGTIRTRDALTAGIHPRTLYGLRDEGVLERLSRGLYRLADLPQVGDPDLALVAGRIPKGVVCLISALALHDLTTQIPHKVHLALPRSSRYPVYYDIPMAVYRYSQASYAAGITERDIGGATVRVYDPEKTIADCFKYRNKIGLDIAIEALKDYWRTGSPSASRIHKYAEINRVGKVIIPYLETLA